MPKQAESSTTRRSRLARRVALSPYVMTLPCSNCRNFRPKSGDPPRICKIDLSSSRCSECLAHNSKCDLVVTDKDWSKLDESKRKLELELEEIEERKSELDVRRLRLRKQLGLLSSREEEMMKREMASIAELERLEREAGLLTDAAAASSDLTASNFDWAALDPPSWSFPVGTPSTSASNVSSSW